MKSKFANTPLMDTKLDLVVKVVKEGSRWNAFDQNGKMIPRWISTGQRQKAEKSGMALRRLFYKDGRPYWRMVPMSEYETTVKSPSDNFRSDLKVSDIKTATPVSYSGSAGLDLDGVYKPFTNQEEVIKFLHNSYSLKPKKVFINELKWRHLVRTVIRGKNTMITGMQGSGKTLVAKTVASVIGRPFFAFNLGETQDPKTYLLGTTHADAESGTVFYPSRFIRAIQTKGAIILLDELTRSHPEAWNILMSVLDESQRYIVLDESRENAIIKVAEGVTFVSTANIGSEFTATRVMDRALSDRFTFVEMDPLTKEEETSLLSLLFPSLDPTLIESVADISSTTRTEWKSANPKLSTAISTRLSVEVCGLLFDGFSLAEAAEVAIYPFFSADGGTDSERTYVKQLVQKFVDDGTSVPFGPNQVNNAPTNR